MESTAYNKYTLINWSRKPYNFNFTLLVSTLKFAFITIRKYNILPLQLHIKNIISSVN